MNFDFVIVGGGIVGLTLARELARRHKGRIAVLEKESDVGMHASGRNSGVVHAGIYYAADSLKARFCVEGARDLLAYVDEHKLPVLKCGKVIVAAKPSDAPTLDVLLKRAQANGVEARRISLQELADIEPEAVSHEGAIWSPRTAVIDSKAVLKQLVQELTDLGVAIHYNQNVWHIDTKAKTVTTDREAFTYGFLFNTAGVNADKIAHAFGVGRSYRILPFKGLYWKASDSFARKIRTLIYPVPDMTMPFLGVHITRTVDGKVLFGPTAIPAFGRENYTALGGLDLLETPQIGWHLLGMLARNPGNFRSYVTQEMSRYRFKNFFNQSRSLVRGLEPSDIAQFYKVGIRAQLMDTSKGKLEMDFVIERGPDSLHVLNAISPAFTSAFAFAKFLTDEALGPPSVVK